MRLMNNLSPTIKTLRAHLNPAINLQTLETQLRKCRNLNQFNQILSQAIVSGSLRDPSASGKLIKFSTSIDYSLRIFNHLETTNGFLWNTLMRAQTRSASPQNVVVLYKSMLGAGARPDHCTLPILVGACALRSSEREGEEAHGHVIQLGFDSDVYARNNLVHMYKVCGNMVCARKVFDESPVRDLVSWNSILAGYVRAGNVEEARWVFEHMPERDSFTSNSMIALLGGIGHVNEALRLFMDMPENDIVAWSSLISCYERNGMFDKAVVVFVNMNSNGVRVDEVVLISVISACAHIPCLKTGKSIHGLAVKSGNESYTNLRNTLIHMYSSCGDVTDAEKLFNSGNDHVSWNSMISGYLRRGLLDNAKRVFNYMPEPDSITWSALISGFSQNERFSETIQLFIQMLRKGTKPDKTTFSSVISSCTHLALLEQGRSIHALAWKNGVNFDAILGAATTDMYMKCGCVEDGLKLFHETEEISVSSWNSCILGLAINGKALEALDMFSHMKKTGAVPDERTYMAVLAACQHMGLVHEGRAHFKSMVEEHRLEPNVKHYGSMVDLLGRAGLVREAEELVRAMPVSPDAATWGALLAACRKHGDAETGERIGRELVELQPGHDGFHVLLSDIYASRGDWGDVLEIREKMMQQGMVKSAGCSLIER